MSYKDDLIQAIQNREQWPRFERSEFLYDLDTVAGEAFQKNTTEGYLAALLVYHQLCEEMIRLILKDAQFLIQLSVYPNEIIFPDKKRQMFGQFLEELKSTISFTRKDDFIAKCAELNKKRIEIVHNLTRMTSVNQISEEVVPVKVLYEEISELYETIHDYFYMCFSDYHEDFEIDDQLNKL